nr:hypothetical protein [Rhizobium sp. ACO-34A]
MAEEIGNEAYILIAELANEGIKQSVLAVVHKVISTRAALLRGVTKKGL